MIGAEQAGIVETLDYVFKKYTQDVQQTLAQVLNFVHSSFHIGIIRVP
jgi:hypothetical protein